MKVFLIPDKKQIQVTLAALALLCASYTAGTALTPTAYAAEQVETPLISVSASAVIEVAPDTAVISFDVNGKGNNAGAAANAAASKMEGVRRALLGCGLVSSDITTTSYTLYPDMDNKGKVTGYTARNNVKIKLTNIAKLGTVIDKISGAGVDTINNVSFSVSNKSLYRNQLLAQAVENARQQAAVVANAGGRTLGKLLSASISSYNNFERSYGNVMLKSAAMDSAPATNIAAEDITIKASVDTVFAMQ